jgi:hypothetical protein
MSVLVLVFDDGRPDYLARTVASFCEFVQGDEFHVVIHQDEPADQARTRSMFGWCEVIGGDQRSGFAGAIRRAWAHAAQPHFDRFDWVFHLEGDFTFNRKVNVQQLQVVLDSNPHLAQMALVRQAWNQAEIEAGGVVQRHPEAFAEYTNAVGWSWLEHRLFFTTNPSLYRRDLLKAGWPAGGQSEGMFFNRLRTQGLPWGVEGRHVKFGYWGHADDPPWVEHIGVQRTGHGY